MFKKTLAFDDVLLIPQRSDIESRREVSLVSCIGTKTFTLPIISSPMDTVTEGEMCKHMAWSGGFGIVHRYNTIQEQVQIVGKATADGDDDFPAAAAVAAIAFVFIKLRRLIFIIMPPVMVVHRMCLSCKRV